MKEWLRALDRILRGETTKGRDLEEGLASIPLGGMTILIVCLGIVYGSGMGTFALSKDGGPSFAQFFAAAIKIPVLFLTTLVITFPSLYVFNALVGSRLALMPVLRLLICSLAVTLAVLASFGPIVAFFSISTTSYSFMVLLNVLMCAVAGFLGLAFLRQTLHRLTLVDQPARPAPRRTAPAVSAESIRAENAWSPPPEPAAGAPMAPPPLSTVASSPSALDPLDERPVGAGVKGVFRCWMFLFALVGAQMGWVLRPFIGDPSQPFSFFRPRNSNFFAGVWEHFLNLFR